MTPKSKLITIAIISILVLALVIYFSTSYFNNLSSHSTGQAIKETNKVRIGYLPVVHGLPLYLAIEKGYFQDAGIDVELIKMESPNQIVDALMQGRIDFAGQGALGIIGVAEYKNPGKIKVFAISGEIGENTGENLVISKNNTEIKSIKDLKGKRLGIQANSIQWRTIAREILAKEGLDMDKDLTIVELAPSVQVQALAAGQIDALLGIEPTPTIAIEKGIAKMLVKSPGAKAIANPMYYGVDAVNTEFLKNNPDTTKKVIEIFEKSIDEVNENSSLYWQYLKGYTPLTDDIAKKAPVPDFKNIREINDKDKASIQKFYDLFTKYGVVDGKIDFEKFIYNSSD